MSDYIGIEAVIEQHDPALPRYVTIPRDTIAGLGTLDGTTTVEGTINGVDLGRRGLKLWGPDRPHMWFLEIPKGVWSKAGLDVGDSVQLSLRRASEDDPVELVQVLQESDVARERWERLTPSQKRRIREDVLNAKSPAIRTRRARKALL